MCGTVFSRPKSFIEFFCVSFQFNDLNDDYEFSVQFTKNSRGLGFTISSYIGDLNSGNNV